MADPVFSMDAWIRAIRRQWLVLESVRHLGWLLFVYAALYCLTTLALLHHAGGAVYLVLTGAEAWVVVAGALGLLLVKAVRHPPARLVALAERRAGREDNLWITAFEWETVPEACAGSRELFRSLADEARRTTEGLSAFSLVSLKELAFPYLWALLLLAGISTSRALFRPIYPAGAVDSAGVGAQYFRVQAVPPAYMRMGRSEHIGSGCDLELPVRSDVYLRVYFRSPPGYVRMSDGSTGVPLIPCPDSDTCFGAAFRLEQARNLLLFTEGRPPIRCALGTSEDHPPSVKLEAPGDEPSVFEDGLPLQLTAVDDHGIDRVVLRARVNGIEVSRTLLPPTGANARRSFSRDLTLDARLLPLRAADQLEVRIEAHDQGPSPAGLGSSELVRWRAASASMRAVSQLVEEEAGLLWRWVDHLATLSDAEVQPDWNVELAPLQRLTLSWKQLFSPISRHERRAIEQVEEGLKVQRARAHVTALSWTEELVWRWSHVAREHVSGLIDLYREELDGSRGRIEALLRSPAPAPREVRLELARARNLISRIDEVVSRYADLLPPEDGAGGAAPEEDAADWLARLERADGLAQGEDWDGLARLLEGMVGLGEGNPFAPGEGSVDRAWKMRLEALHQKLQGIAEHQQSVSRGVTTLQGARERALARWAAAHLTEVEEEIDLIVSRVRRGIEKVPISDLIDDEINTLKRYQMLQETMREDWAARRYRELDEGLTELVTSLRLLRSDFFLNDLDVRPIQHVLRLSDRMRLLLDRIRRYQPTILGEKGKAVLEEWQEEERSVRRDLRSLEQGFERLSASHSEVLAMTHTASRAHDMARQAEDALEENRVEDALTQGQEVSELLAQLGQACRAATGSMALGHRLVIRVGGDVDISSGADPRARLRDILAPHMRAPVPERYRGDAERYYRYLLEQ
jgi:hypothetical protein